VKRRDRVPLREGAGSDRRSCLIETRLLKQTGRRQARFHPRE
jgi:hypothetical protein